jgi:hypothetical protein
MVRLVGIDGEEKIGLLRSEWQHFWGCGDEEWKSQNPHSWKAKSAAPQGERKSRSLAPLGMTSAQVGTKDKRGARQTHECPSRLLPNSSCTSVDHLLTRQERRSPNVRNISPGVNGYCGRRGKLCTESRRCSSCLRVNGRDYEQGKRGEQDGELNSPLHEPRSRSGRASPAPTNDGTVTR